MDHARGVSTIAHLLAPARSGCRVLCPIPATPFRVPMRDPRGRAGTAAVTVQPL